jgi:myo-inositol-1(or 4)-monophosphatase
MSDEAITARLIFAEALCREAAAIARHHFRSEELPTTYKGAHDPVTVADLEIDRLITRRLGERFPGDAVLSEELGGTVRDDLWIVDPIDGTANFARGIAHFAISIGFMRQGVIEFGVVHPPISGELFAARRGAGATCNGHRLRVRSPHSAANALIDAGYSAKHPVAEYVDQPRSVSPSSPPVASTASASCIWRRGTLPPACSWSRRRVATSATISPDMA